ncbi:MULTISPECIES: SWIM zinc finger family protein [unclassified Streptomyces]|uniref:SWIM zinc finger family protein n=1 Tax=unclassified Streptomyces TaxID=2593676 RepID=UPI0038056F04
MRAARERSQEHLRRQTEPQSHSPQPPHRTPLERAPEQPRQRPSSAPSRESVAAEGSPAAAADPSGAAPTPPPEAAPPRDVSPTGTSPQDASPAGTSPRDASSPASASAQDVSSAAPSPRDASSPTGTSPQDVSPAGTSTQDASTQGVPSGIAESGGTRAAAGSRPGDVAREALRAARAQARQGTAEGPAQAGHRAGHRTGRSGLRPRTDARTDARLAEARRPDRARDPVADERARVVRELLAGAFQMPSEDAGEPEADPGDAGAVEAGAPPPIAPERAPSLPQPQEPPHTPRSMAAPARDGDHRRTFPAFPPRTGGSFAGTWWGNAWVTALEEGALDPKRLARGRGYAEQGNVDAITVTPGLVLAYVQGSRPRPYRVQVRLRTLGNEDWERFLEAAAERPGHIAALLDKEMPESLAECGVPLLPGPGDLEPQCSCPDRGHPCKHAAALCYQTARLLDADPFVLLLLRGRGEREVLDALSRRNATRAARAAQEQEPEPLPGVRAAEALAERRLPPLPAPLPLPAHPEQPPAYPSAPGGPDSFALDHLATDAAARAHALLTTGHDEIGELDLWRDAVRLAASRPGSGLTVSTRALYAALASAVGRTPSELARAVAAWRQGGPDGLTVLEETWDPPAGRFDRARPLLLAADLPAFRPSRNHLTHPRGHVQLRFGRDGLWYAYESEPGHDDWWPRGTPDPDPVGALTGLGGSDAF